VLWHALAGRDARAPGADAALTDLKRKGLAAVERPPALFFYPVKRYRARAFSLRRLFVTEKTPGTELVSM
jgi:hypothetical protein